MKWLSVVLLCAVAGSASAEINMADSLEWQAVDSTVIVRGFVTAVTERKGEGDVIWYDATVRIAESIKGGAKQTLHVGIRELSGRTPEDWRKAKTDLLLFLVPGKDRAADDKDFARYVYVLRPVHGSGASAYELGTTQAYTAAFTVLTKPTEVLAATRAAVRSRATVSHRIDVPWDTPAMKALWGGSVVWMTVPVDGALEKRALQLVASKGVSDREQGARALAHFKSAANIARMKQLLADPDYAESSSNGAATMKRYLVRIVADEALTTWNVPHATPVVEEPLVKRP